MFCRKCGKELPDDSAFCVACGTAVNAEPAEQPKVQRTVRITPVSFQMTTSAEPKKTEEKAAAEPEKEAAPEAAEEKTAEPAALLAVKEAPPAKTKPAVPQDPPGTPSATLIFVLGIVAIALSFDISLAGLIVSLVTLGKVKEREEAVGELTGKAKTGKMLASIALPVSIAFLALAAISAVWAVIVAMIGGAATIGQALLSVLGSLINFLNNSR